MDSSLRTASFSITSRRALSFAALLAFPLLGGFRCDPVPQERACPDIWAPVCGVDGVTYGNSCQADLEGVEIASEGECQAERRLCLADTDCAQNERCDDTECLSGCTGDGPCPAVCYGLCVPVGGEDPCACTREYAPVCGVDDTTYGNACNARCAGVEVAYAGECAAPAGGCQIGGCSSQLCVEEGDEGVSTCEWLEEYACFRSAECARQTDGRCGWTETDELRACLAAPGER